MASTYLQRTPSTTGNRKKWTWSTWIKRSKIGASQYLLSSFESSSTETSILFNNSDQLDVFNWYGNAYNGRKTTNMKFRDTNAWYHIVVNLDLDHATADDRFQIYVNGERITSFATSSNPTTGSSTVYNLSSINMKLGTYDTGNTYKFDGYMAHVHWVDGLQLDADTFGETDNTTGIWKAKTSPTISDYGTNGFFLDFADSSAMGNDISGNNNDFTVSGTMTQTIDTPSNVFATGNPLYYYNGAFATWSNGNNTCYTGSAQTGVNRATLGASEGKYYWEVKIGASDGAGNIWQGVGVVGELKESATDELGDRSWEYGYWGQDGTVRNNDLNIATYSTFTTNDIISVAMDLDNYKLYFAKNGTWQNSADPAAGTGGITLKADPSDGFYFPAWGDWDNNNRFYFHLNFGNGYFGTTAVASAGTNSGIGTFEYDVPSGYKALCTKNINAQEYS